MTISYNFLQYTKIDHLPVVTKGLFSSGAQVRVLSVNARGNLGGYVLQEFLYKYGRQRPEVASKMREAIQKGRRRTKDADGNLVEPRLQAGKAFPWKPNKDASHGFIFAVTCDQAGKGSSLYYVEQILQQIAAWLPTSGVTSIAFTKLGCGAGHQKWHDVGPLFAQYLGNIEGVQISVYIDEHDVQYQLDGEGKVVAIAPAVKVVKALPVKPQRPAAPAKKQPAPAPVAKQQPAPAPAPVAKPQQLVETEETIVVKPLRIVAKQPQLGDEKAQVKAAMADVIEQAAAAVQASKAARRPRSKRVPAAANA